MSNLAENIKTIEPGYHDSQDFSRSVQILFLGFLSLGPQNSLSHVKTLSLYGIRMQADMNLYLATRKTF